jgi:phosphoribosyl 1,2-cyclic phosphodiesterase
MANVQKTDATMRIKYYGVRGSLPTPMLPRDVEIKIKQAVAYIIKKSGTGTNLKEIFNKLPFHVKSTYGGNTPCVYIQIGDHSIILDGGSGLRGLGIDLMKRDFGKGKGHALFFFSHTHWDHIQGLPFFIPLFIKGNSFDFYYGLEDLEDRLRGQYDPRYFPIDMDYMQADKVFSTIPTGTEKDFGDFTVKVLQQNHPGHSFAYRIEADGRTFVYSTDVEFNDKNYNQLYEAIDFYKGADILTFDTMYTLEEALNKIDWGHSSTQIGIDIAHHGNIKKVVLYHYDPTFSDEQIHQMVEIGKSYKNKLYPDSEIGIFPSYEGLELLL